jgi:DNA-binding NtrC family response regulator
VLARQEVDLVFCDEYLPDGSYSDLIHSNHWNHKIPRVVVTTRHGDWDLYFEALRKGAFDITRSPWHATDVEMLLIHALLPLTRSPDNSASIFVFEKTHRRSQ